MAYGFGFGTLVYYNLGCDWVLSDFDEFHGDIFPSALVIDHLIFFVGMDPYTTISSIAYLAFVLASICILAINERLLRVRDHALLDACAVSS